MTDKKNGVRIKNIQCGSLYEFNLGVRDRFDYVNSAYDNSGLYKFLVKNGLKTSKNGKYTEDIICIEFDYGSRSYEEESKRLEELIGECDIEEEKDRVERLLEVKEKVELNKNLYHKLSKEEIRHKFYSEGVSILYPNSKKPVKYKMLYRSSGKAKNGSCIFINEKLYKKAYNFIYMDIKLPKKNSPIIEASGYVSLIASSTIADIVIDPWEVLILEDVDRCFETNVVSVEIDENKECVAKHLDNYKLKNTLFDGQAIVEAEIFPKWANGFILLRQHMTKMAGFKCYIQKFFKDYFGDSYETAVVMDMFGNYHLAKDIKMITTDNAMKWLNKMGQLIRNN